MELHNENPVPFGAGFSSLIGRHTVKTNACLLALIAVLLSTFLLPLPARAQTNKSRSGWQLTFDDEFTGPTLDTRKWTASEGTFPNRSEPLQYFLPEAVTLDGGGLHIHSEYRLSHGLQYTSGEIRTLDKFSQRYGRLETRCRFPKAMGAWSAVYLLPADDDWPPEIDVAEYIGRDPQKIYLTNHWKDGAGEHQQVNKDWTDSAADWGAWHTYAVEWEPNTVHWYIDGVLRGKAYGPVSDVPMYIRINSSVGGNFAGEPQPNEWPQTFDVAYVRMYRRSGGPKPILRPLPHIQPPPPPVVFPFGSDQPTQDATPPDAPNGWDSFLLIAVPIVVWGLDAATNQPRGCASGGARGGCGNQRGPISSVSSANHSVGGFMDRLAADSGRAAWDTAHTRPTIYFMAAFQPSHLQR